MIVSKRNYYNGTAYWVYNDDPKLPVIVMIHGYRGTHHGLELIAQNLPDYRIIIPDLPGFGESKPLNKEHSTKNYAIWLDQFIKNLKLKKPPVLLGHSFGSIVASFFAKDHPDAISKLILINPIGAPATSGPHTIETKIALGFYGFSNKLPEAAAVRLLSLKIVIITMTAIMAKTHDRKLKKYIYNQHSAHFNAFANRQVVTESFKASVQTNVRQVAADITTPTLLIVGDRDDITPLVSQKQLAESLENVELVVFNDVGHLIHYERPVETAAAIREFINS